MGEEVGEMKFDSFRELVVALGEFVDSIVAVYGMSARDMARLCDCIKSFAVEYHQLVIDGKIKPEDQYRVGSREAIDFINSLLEGEEF